MSNKMLIAVMVLCLPFAAAGQNSETKTLQPVTVSPVVTSQPLSCAHQLWPTSGQIRNKLQLSSDTSVARLRADAIRESRAMCRQDYTHVQWHYHKVGQQFALVVR